MRKCFLIIVFCFLFVPQVMAQSGTSGEEAMKHIEYLASDEFKGRMTGTPEYDRAAEYVRDKMKEYGLKPGAGDDKWFQDVPFRNWSYFLQPIRFEITSPVKRTFFAGRRNDYMPVNGSGSGTVKGQLVFAGYGIVSPENDWDDYNGLDVGGKIVLFVNGTPETMKTEFAGKEGSVSQKITTAVDKGAAGVVVMNVPNDPYIGYRLSLRSGICPEDFVVVSANSSLLDYVFYTSNLSWRHLVSATIRNKKSHYAALNVEAEIEVHQIKDSITSPNVIGILEGTDSELKDEYLVIGAHLDHLGVGVDGFIYNGADDDASGVAVVLDVARALNEAEFKPKRSVVFCAWTGEELGLVGSSFYTKNPPYPLEKTAVYMNMDMVGTGDLDMYIGGMWEFSDFYDIVRRGLSDSIKDNLRYRLKYRGSDHTPFVNSGVTSISLRSGGLLSREIDDEHPEYHLPGDMANTINVEALDQAARYHYDIVRHLANCDDNLLDPVHHMNFVHRDATVVDLHCDTVMRLPGADLTKDNEDGHIDIPKLKSGAVDLQVFACYVGPPENELEKNTAARKIFGMIDQIEMLATENSDDLAMVRNYRDLRNEYNTGRVGVLLAIEGGYAIENDLGLLRSFHRAGVRLMTLTHWTRTDWADASGDEEAKLGGLTDFGEEVVKEMNRIGMIVDVSHVHDETFWDVIRVTEDPVIATHSCARALSDFHRNMSDDMLRALADNGGMIGINYLPFFLNIGHEEHNEKVTVKTVVDHIDHIISVTGSADHVGLGSDFDGISETPEGLEDTSKIFAITHELFERGYDEKDIRKILGGNFIRIFRKVCDK